MASTKISAWTAKPGRKLRVVFEDDQFAEYVDLPDVAGFQHAWERMRRAQTQSKVSVYKPASDYRDGVTPPLNPAHNLRVVELKDVPGFAS